MQITHRLLFTGALSLSAVLATAQDKNALTTEKDYQEASRAAYKNNNSSKGDSLVEVAIARFPKGAFARNDFYNKQVNKQMPSAEKLKVYNKWIKAFPEPKDSPDIVYDYARSGISWSYAEENNPKQNQAWINKIKSQEYRAVIEVHDGTRFLGHKDTVTAEKLIRAGVADAEKSYPLSKNPMAKGDYYYALNALSTLLYHERKYAEALQYASMIYNGGGNRDKADVKKNYALLLAANNKPDSALLLLTELISSGEADNEVKTKLPAIYASAKGSDAGYAAFAAELEATMRIHIQDRVKKELLSETAPVFTLKDLDGNTVSTADLKGKILVLDFWATWCGPCKRSFPAMQKTVNKYKNDPNVKFLFIDTWERVADPSKDVKKFIGDNNYTFQVLLDDKTTGVVSQFKVRGIPAKFIIDGAGNTRFKLTGFSGGDDAAVEELSAMIEMIR
ncbi:TlpA disulfide reductase family protein [Chitinophaga filiformis]|uniref:Thiol-disulfide isomerase or thioredoxin n=1 Tax=Chitinophaga filiformis TaxID=104663 RepID=A0A1G7PE48_CHIFI|nr:TlpA disulfide reductase family protein [Chitinophaga filiformis]SDF83909.1 Thiol-disulfide isomerase or thioredoxin [Chitinophaga filiformis]